MLLNGNPRVYTCLAKNNANNTLKIITGGMKIQYDQKMVRLISRSNAFPDTAAVICANMRASGEHTRITLTMTKTGLLKIRSVNTETYMRRKTKPYSWNTSCQSYFVVNVIPGIEIRGVIIILDATNRITVFCLSRIRFYLIFLWIRVRATKDVPRRLQERFRFRRFIWWIKKGPKDDKSQHFPVLAIALSTGCMCVNNACFKGSIHATKSDNKADQRGTVITLFRMAAPRTI